MIECPRCGFLQPKDKYCANCGVDMDNFHPAPKPLHQRLLSNPLFYLAAFTLVIGSSAIYLMSQPESKTGSELRHLIYSPSAKDKEADRLREEERLQRKREQEQQAEALAQRQMLQQNAPSANPVTVSETTTPKAPSTDQNPMVLPTPDKVTIEFFEVGQSSIGEILKKSDVITEGSDFQALELKAKEANPLLSEIGGILESLPGQETKTIQQGTNFNVNFLDTTDAGEFGLTLQVSIKELTPQNTTIELSGEVILKPTSEGSSNTSSLSGTYKLKAGSSLAIVGFVPKVPAAADSDEDRFPGTPLSILNSPNFTNPSSEQPTEFVMTFSLKP